MKKSPSSLRNLLPRTRSCFVCGVKNPHGLHVRSRLEADGRVVLEYTTRESDVGYRHIVHGGILMTLADEAMTWAAIVGTQRVCVAAEISVRLRKPVAPGESLCVEATCDDARSRLVYVSARILDSRAEEVASAMGKYMPMRPEDAHLARKDFVVSPDSIIPEVLAFRKGISRDKNEPN